MFVGRFQQTERDAIHFRLRIHVRAVQEPVLVALEELRHRPRDRRELGVARANVGVEVRAATASNFARVLPERMMVFPKPTSSIVRTQRSTSASGGGVVVRMDVDDGIPRLLNPCFGNFENRTRLVVLKQHFLRRGLGRGRPRDDKNGEPIDGLAASRFCHGGV